MSVMVSKITRIWLIFQVVEAHTKAPKHRITTPLVAGGFPHKVPMMQKALQYHHIYDINRDGN